MCIYIYYNNQRLPTSQTNWATWIHPLKQHAWTHVVDFESQAREHVQVITAHPANRRSAQWTALVWYSDPSPSAGYSALSIKKSDGEQGRRTVGWRSTLWWNIVYLMFLREQHTDFSIATCFNNVALAIVGLVRRKKMRRKLMFMDVGGMARNAGDGCYSLVLLLIMKKGVRRQEQKEERKEQRGRNRNLDIEEDSTSISTKSNFSLCCGHLHQMWGTREDDIDVVTTQWVVDVLAQGAITHGNFWNSKFLASARKMESPTFRGPVQQHSNINFNINTDNQHQHQHQQQQ